VSFIFVVGKWAGFKVERCDLFFRVVIGFFALWILYSDFEILLDRIKLMIPAKK